MPYQISGIGLVAAFGGQANGQVVKLFKAVGVAGVFSANEGEYFTLIKNQLKLGG